MQNVNFGILTWMGKELSYLFVFQRSQLDKDVMNNKFIPYKLIEDATNP